MPFLKRCTTPAGALTKKRPSGAIPNGPFFRSFFYLLESPRFHENFPHGAVQPSRIHHAHSVSRQVFWLTGHPPAGPSHPLSKALYYKTLNAKQWLNTPNVLIHSIPPAFVTDYSGGSAPDFHGIPFSPGAFPLNSVAIGCTPLTTAANLPGAPQTVHLL